MNGFYPMLNDVHDKAVKDLPLAECALFEHIWRKLIGWNKFEDEISISQLVKETMGSRRTIIRLLNNLEEKRWIVVTRQVSETKRKFTSKIAIPACPGVKARLGWCQNGTRGGIDMTPGGSAKSIHTTDSSSTDNLQTTITEEVAAVLPLAEEQVAEQKSDRLRVFGAVSRRYSNQLMGNLPSEGKVMDLLELYAIDVIEEALGRMPIVLVPTNPKTKVTGDYVLSKIDQWVTNPSWGLSDTDAGGAGQSMGDRDRAKAAKDLAHMKAELADLESKPDGDWSEHIMAMRVAITEAEVR